MGTFEPVDGRRHATGFPLSRLFALLSVACISLAFGFRWSETYILSTATRASLAKGGQLFHGTRADKRSLALTISGTEKATPDTDRGLAADLISPGEVYAPDTRVERVGERAQRGRRCGARACARARPGTKGA